MTESPLAYIPTDRRHALVRGDDLPRRARGAALFADISGFTPLTEALVTALGPQRGAEQLLIQLNRIYDALVAEVDDRRGSVMVFSGDAITCWFDDGGDGGWSDLDPAERPGPVQRATATALAIQRTMEQFALVEIPGAGEVVARGEGGRRRRPRRAVRRRRPRRPDRRRAGRRHAAAAGGGRAPRRAGRRAARRGRGRRARLGDRGDRVARRRRVVRTLRRAGLVRRRRADRPVARASGRCAQRGADPPLAAAAGGRPARRRAWASSSPSSGRRCRCSCASTASTTTATTTPPTSSTRSSARCRRS